MKILTLTLAAMVLLMSGTACTSVKRFKSATYKGEDLALVDMALFGASLDALDSETAGKNLWELSAGAQTQMIQILNERYPDNEQFIGALNQEYLLRGKGPLIDYTTRNLRMVFTISRERDFASLGDGSGRFSPADRIEHLKFTLEIPPEYNLHFTGWNRYTTEYGELEIADVSFSRSIDLEAAWEGESIDAGVQRSVSRSEKQVVKSRYLKLNGSISDRKLEIEEEGTREIDLTGNVIADVSLVFDGFPERITLPLYSSGEKGSPPQVTALKYVDVMVPLSEGVPDVIMATLELEYVYRHVEVGWDTYQEWDDRVAYYTGTLTRQIPLLKKHEYLPLLFCIGTDLEGKEAIKIHSHTGTEYPLRFASHAEASRFLDWMVLHSGKAMISPGSCVAIGEDELIFKSKGLTWDIVGGEIALKVMPVF